MHFFVHLYCKKAAQTLLFDIIEASKQTCKMQAKQTFPAGSGREDEYWCFFSNFAK